MAGVDPPRVFLLSRRIFSFRQCGRRVLSFVGVPARFARRWALSVLAPRPRDSTTVNEMTVSCAEELGRQTPAFQVIRKLESRILFMAAIHDFDDGCLVTPLEIQMESSTSQRSRMRCEHLRRTGLRRGLGVSPSIASLEISSQEV